MSMKLISIKFHKKELKDSTEKWWILVFRYGDESVVKRIEDKQFNSLEWHAGALYEFSGINPEDIKTDTIREQDKLSSNDGRVQSELKVK